MKKILSLLAIVMLGISAMAQTNFRHISFEEAKAAAKAENKLVFVDFYTSWCGPCKNMANNVFPQVELGNFMNSKFVCVKYDAEKEELELVKNSMIEAYPTFVVFNADGIEVGRKVGGSSAEAFMADMERLSNPELTPEKIRASYDAGNRNATLIKAYASLLQEEAGNSRKAHAEKMQQIETIVNEYYNGLTDDQKLKAENLFIYAEYCESTADAKIQYLFANRDKVAETDRKAVNEILTKAYKYEGAYFVGFRKPFVKADYETWRSQVKEIPGIESNMVNSIINVMDAYATGDMNKYLAAAQKESKKNKELSTTILSGFEGGLEKADEATRMKAAKYIRSLLSEMEYSEIYFMAMTIGSLEGARQKH